jgi:hypothetical protein
MLIAAGSKLFLRHQARTCHYYVVQGLTPIRLAGCPMFFEHRADAVAALKLRGWEPIAGSDELRKVGV